MTAGEVIDLVQRDLKNASDAECLDDLQAIHDDLAFSMRLKPSTQTLSSLVSGTASYALSTGWARVFGVRYYTSATSYEKLKPTSKDELDSFRQYWRTETGEPDSYYIDGGNIVLVPAANETSSGSYPQVQVDLSLTETLADATTLPTGISSYRAWVEGTKMLVAARYEDPRFNLYAQRYDIYRKRLFEQIQQGSAEYKPRILPPGASQSFRVRR